MMLKVLDVDGAVRRVKGGWESTGEEWAYDADRYKRVAADRTAEQQAMLAYLTTDGCREMFLRRHLDDDTATPCGRCDNCTGATWDADVAETAVKSAHERLVRPGIDLEPRRQWPTGLEELKGASSRNSRPAPAARSGGSPTSAGAPVSRNCSRAPTSPYRTTSSRRSSRCSRAGAGSSGRSPSSVSPRSPNPSSYAASPSASPTVGRLTYLGELGYRNGSPGKQFNSNQRVQAIRATLAMPRDLAAKIAEAGGPVLLVDDRADTGWTLTLAAAQIRHAGAPQVLPLVLAAAT